MEASQGEIPQNLAVWILFSNSSGFRADYAPATSSFAHGTRFQLHSIPSFGRVPHSSRVSSPRQLFHRNFCHSSLYGGKKLRNLWPDECGSSCVNPCQSCHSRATLFDGLIHLDSRSSGTKFSKIMDDDGIDSTDTQKDSSMPPPHSTPLLASQRVKAAARKCARFLAGPKCTGQVRPGSNLHYTSLCNKYLDSCPASRWLLPGVERLCWRQRISGHFQAILARYNTKKFES